MDGVESHWNSIKKSTMDTYQLEGASPAFNSDSNEQPDDELIGRFLAPLEPSEIAALAATLLTGGATQDLEAAVDKAVELRWRVENMITMKRDALLRSMNEATLSELRSMFETQYLGPEDHPVRRPLATLADNERRRRLDEKSAEYERHQKQSNESILEQAAGRTSIPMPATPCAIEPGLRWVTNERQISWKILESAFADYLGCCYIESRKVTDSREIEFRKGRIEDWQKALASLKTEHRSDQEKSQRRREFWIRINATEREIADLESKVNYLQNFRPGLDTPKSVRDYVNSKYRHFEGNESAIQSRDHLAELIRNFYPFWLKHADAYRSIDRIARKAERDRRAKLKSNASKTTNARERNKWSTVVRAFIDECKDSSAGLNNIRWFKKPVQIRQKLKEDTIHVFLETTIKAVTAGMSAYQLQSALDAEKLSVTEGILQECMDMIGKVVNRPRGS